MKTMLTCGIAVVLPLVLASCDGTRSKLETAGDTTFARETFESLARGDSSAADDIDWPVFTALGQNVGASYTALDTPEEQEKFVNGFITQFAAAFRETGGSADEIANWRVKSHDSQKTLIMADAPRGELHVTVSERNGEERVSSIDISE